MIDAQRTQDDFIAFFHRHLVPMVFVFKMGDITARYIITTFVLSVRERWFLVTAGHCLEEVDKYNKEGFSIHQCFLMDSMGTGATHFEPFIFPYDLAKPQYNPKSREMDYGIIPLSNLYQGLLKANKISPLNEEFWRIQRDDPEFFALLGVPKENLQIGENSVGIVTALNWIEECEKPDNVPDTDVPLFYGKITLHSDQKSVRGMSGGPIFAFKEVNGRYKYWLKALQSRWIEQSEIVIGCPTTFLGNVIDKMISEKII